VSYISVLFLDQLLYIKQEAPLPRRAQRVRRAYLVYLITFLWREFVDGY